MRTQWDTVCAWKLSESESGLGGTRDGHVACCCWPRVDTSAGIQEFGPLAPSLGFLSKVPPYLRAQGKDHPRQEELPRTGKVLMSITKGLGEGDTNSESSLYYHFRGLSRRGVAPSCLVVPRPRGSWRGAPASLLYPAEGLRERGEVSAPGAMSRVNSSSKVASRGQDRSGITQEHQTLEGLMD